MSEGTKLWIFYIALRGPLLWELLCKYCKWGFILTSGINRHIRLYQRNFYFLQEFVSKLFLDGSLTFRSFGSAELLFVESSPLCYVWQEFWSYSIFINKSFWMTLNYALIVRPVGNRPYFRFYSFFSFFFLPPLSRFLLLLLFFFVLLF